MIQKKGNCRRWYGRQQGLQEMWRFIMIKATVDTYWHIFLSSCLDPLMLQVSAVAHRLTVGARCKFFIQTCCWEKQWTVELWYKTWGGESLDFVAKEQQVETERMMCSRVFLECNLCFNGLGNMAVGRRIHRKHRLYKVWGAQTPAHTSERPLIFLKWGSLPTFSSPMSFFKQIKMDYFCIF